MKKLNLVVLFIIGLLTLTACSTANPDRVKRPSYGGYTAFGECIGCEDAQYTAVDQDVYGHNFQRTDDRSSVATIAGALIVGGILFAAIGKGGGDNNRNDDDNRYDEDEDEDEDDLDDEDDSDDIEFGNEV